MIALSDLGLRISSPALRGHPFPTELCSSKTSEEETAKKAGTFALKSFTVFASNVVEEHASTRKVPQRRTDEEIYVQSVRTGPQRPTELSCDKLIGLMVCTGTRHVAEHMLTHLTRGVPSAKEDWVQGHDFLPFVHLIPFS